MKNFKKVTALVIANQSSLLVFDHPLTGTQLPAGSVEEDEDLVEAARREVFEETGILVNCGEIVGTSVEPLVDHGILLCDVTNEQQQTILRGHKVRMISRSNDTIVVREEIYDYSLTPPTLERSTQIKTSIENVTFSIERTFAVSFKIVVAFSDSWKASKFMLPSEFRSLNSVHSIRPRRRDSNRDTYPTNDLA